MFGILSFFSLFHGYKFSAFFFARLQLFSGFLFVILTCGLFQYKTSLPLPSRHVLWILCRCFQSFFFSLPQTKRSQNRPSHEQKKIDSEWKIEDEIKNCLCMWNECGMAFGNFFVLLHLLHTNWQAFTIVSFNHFGAKMHCSKMLANIHISNTQSEHTHTHDGNNKNNINDDGDGEKQKRKKNRFQ